MGRVVNENRSTTALVEKYINSSYDTVKKVADNLDAILALEDTVLEFAYAWQGNLDANPETRPDGTPLQEGDRYYNELVKTTFVYSNGSWVNSGASITTVQVATENAGWEIVGPDTVITLDAPYTPGANSILVYVNAAYQYPISADPSGAYEETNDTTLTFIGTVLEPTDIVTVVQGIPLPAINPIISVTQRLYIAETVDQTLIPLPDGLTYTPGSNNLDVHVNGIYKISPVDYEETSTTSITLSEAVQPGDEVVFKQGNLVGNSPTDLVNLTILSTTNGFYENPNLNTEHAILTKGGNTQGDGSGGLFIYDSTVPKAEANGYTVVDTEKSLGLQGTGSGNGCWLRQYEDVVRPAWYNSPYRGIAAFRSSMQGIRPVAGDVAQLVGFYENSEIGGGTFVYDPDLPASNHNGGTVISHLATATPGDAAWYTAPVAADGCWVRLLEGERVTAAMFGVPTDGFTDATAAFTAAGATGYPVEVPVRAHELTAVGAIAGTFYSYGDAQILLTGSGSITITPLI
jgi:hypothetical protein